MNLFQPLLQSSWKACLASVVLGAISGPIMMTMIGQIHRGLSEPDADMQYLGTTFVLALAAALATQVTTRCILVRLSSATAARFQLVLFSRIIAAPLSNLESLGPHRLLETLRSDINAVASALSQLPAVCAGAMILVSGIGYMALLSVPLAIFTIFMALAGIVTYLIGVHWSNHYLSRSREDLDSVSKQLLDLVTGIKELKGNDRRCTSFVFDSLLPADTVMREGLIKGMDINGAAHSWGRLAMFIGVGILVFAVPALWPVSRETLAGYVLTILYLTGPLDSILGWLPAMNSATIALNKIESLELMTDPSDAPPVNQEPKSFKTIQLRDVTYEYNSPNGQSGFQLGPINLTISAGEVLFIAGGNGSGKTTLAKLLTGLYTPQEGALLWNDLEISHATLGNYRQLFSSVFVDGHLFDRLIGVDPEPEELEYWLSQLGIADKVDRKTGKLAVNRVSRGQHKRLALLVACLDNRPIYLFDEWAAEQDPSFKEKFYRQIVPQLKERGRTVVAITHDDRYFFAADRVVQLADGRIEPHRRQVAA